MDPYAQYFPGSDPSPSGGTCGCWKPMGIAGSGAIAGQAGSGDGLFGIPWLVLLAIGAGVFLLSNNSNTRGGS